MSLAKRKRLKFPRNRVHFTLYDRIGSALKLKPGGRITTQDVPKGRKTPYRTKGPMSTNVRLVQYDNRARMMTIHFRRKAGDAVYEYYNMPLAEFRKFKKTLSAGKWTWRNLRRPLPYGRYRYKRIK